MFRRGPAFSLVWLSHLFSAVPVRPPPPKRCRNRASPCRETRPGSVLAPRKARRCRSLGPFTKKGAFAAVTPDPGSRDDPRGGVDTNALTSAAIVPESTMRSTHPPRISPKVATACSVAVTWLIRYPERYHTVRCARHDRRPCLPSAHSFKWSCRSLNCCSPFPVCSLPESVRLSALRLGCQLTGCSELDMEGRAFPNIVTRASDALGSAAPISRASASRRLRGVARISREAHKELAGPTDSACLFGRPCSLWLPAVRSRGAVVCRAGTPCGLVNLTVGEGFFGSFP